MPRCARVLSKTGIYHIMLRGNERKSIFIDEEDKKKIIAVLYDKKKNNEFVLYAYCVMDNHIHLLLKEKTASIASIMKRIGTSYAYYFNQKYKRVGHVFQDRYKSEPIEDERYLLSVIRYIHKNPEKACLEQQDKYQWSSFKLYSCISPENRDMREVLGFFSNDINKAVKKFLVFSKREDVEAYLDIENENTAKIPEERVMDYIMNYLDENKIKVSDLIKPEYGEIRDRLLRDLTKYTDLSKRKIAELTGVNREIVRKVTLSGEPSH